MGHLRSLEVNLVKFTSFEGIWAIIGHLRSFEAVRATKGNWGPFRPLLAMRSHLWLFKVISGHSNSFVINLNHLRSLELFVGRSGHSGLFGVIFQDISYQILNSTI